MQKVQNVSRKALYRISPIPSSLPKANLSVMTCRKFTDFSMKIKADTH